MSTQIIPISIRGRYFWQGDKRFLVRGVVYQIRGQIDPLTDDCITQLEHDVSLFKELGLNCLFVYSIDNTKAHAKAMALLADAGIYVVTTLSTPTCAINRFSPYESYTSIAITSFFATVDVMASYPNTLGIVAASQIVNNDDTISATPVIKAVVRDLKRYMKLKKEVSQQRILPLCYDAAETGIRDRMILDYLSSGDEASKLDFWACKKYSWVDNSSMAESGYDDLLHQFKDVNLPIFLSEYSDSKHQPRLFQETRTLYSSRMNQVLSGGCAYEFWQDANEYGLVELIRHGQDSRSMVFQRALTRANDENKVFQKRDTDQGTLLIYYDYKNYKESLAATRDDDDADDDLGVMSDTDTEVKAIDMAQSSWPWGPKFLEPESCINWEETERLLRDYA